MILSSPSVSSVALGSWKLKIYKWTVTKMLKGNFACGTLLWIRKKRWNIKQRNRENHPLHTLLLNTQKKKNPCLTNTDICPILPYESEQYQGDTDDKMYVGMGGHVRWNQAALGILNTLTHHSVAVAPSSLQFPQIS